MAAKVLIGIGFVVPTLIAFLATLFIFPKYGDDKGFKNYFTRLENWYGILIAFISFVLSLIIMLGIKENA